MLNQEAQKQHNHMQTNRIHTHILFKIVKE